MGFVAYAVDRFVACLKRYVETLQERIGMITIDTSNPQRPVITWDNGRTLVCNSTDKAPTAIASIERVLQSRERVLQSRQYAPEQSQKLYCESFDYGAFGAGLLLAIYLIIMALTV